MPIRRIYHSSQGSIFGLDSEADLRGSATGSYSKGPRNFLYFLFFFLYSGKLGKHNVVS